MLNKVKNGCPPFSTKSTRPANSYHTKYTYIKAQDDYSARRATNKGKNSGLAAA